MAVRLGPLAEVRLFNYSKPLTWVQVLHVELDRRFARAREGKHLAWEPMLKDAPCFERFANDPEYLTTVRHFDDLRAMLRNRLPDTLAQHGVSLN